MIGQLSYTHSLEYLLNKGHISKELYCYIRSETYLKHSVKKNHTILQMT